MSDLLPSPVSPGRWFQFSLRTVFVVVLLSACCLLIFRQAREIRVLRSVTAAHGLDDSVGKLSPTDFRIQVRKLSNSLPPAVYEIVIETLGDASLTVGGRDGKTSSRIMARSGLRRSSVLIVADLVDDVDESTNKLRYLVQAGTSTGSSGGRGLKPVPKAKTFAELFDVIIKPGIYPRGTPLPMSILDGDVTTLNVQ